MKRILTLITALAMAATVNNAVAQDLMSDTWWQPTPWDA